MNAPIPIRAKLITAAALIFIAADIVHDFRENDPVHYFARNPGQLFWVAVFSIGGGLIALLFSRSSPRWQRYIKLFTLGVAATSLTVFTIDMLMLFVQISRFAGISNFPLTNFIVPLGLATGAAVLWFLFNRLARK
jgi:hypothetical protein